MESGLRKLFDVLITVMTGYLFLISIFGSVFVQVYAEAGNLENAQSANFFLPDQWILNLLILAGFYVLFRLCYKRWREGEQHNSVRNIWKWLCIVYFIAGFLFIFGAGLQPKSDPAKVLNAAEQLLEGDSSSFTDPEGYMFRYPFQNGILLLDAGLLCLFGDGAYLAFQVLNLVAAVGISDAIGRISEETLCHKNEGYWIRIAILLQPVLFFYITYLYGTLLSLACILYAAWFEIRFLRSGGKWNFLFCSLLSGLSIVLKSNSMIPLLGMLIFLLLDLLHKKRREAVLKNLCLMAGILVFCAVFREGTNLLTEMLSKTAMPAGMPKLNWIAMGLSGDGTYNGVSVNIFRESGFDTKQSMQNSWSSIKGSLKYFFQHPGYFAAWYGKKIALQWNDPSFGAVQINRLRESSCHSRALQSLLYGKAGSVLWGVLNRMQSVVLFGALVWYLGKEKKKTQSYFFGVVSLGGFLFHSFWEAGSQYILPYYLLLVPYAVAGWKRLCLFSVNGMIKHKWQGTSVRTKGCALILAFFISLLGSQTWLVRSLVRIQDEPAVLQEFYQREEFNHCHMGAYDRAGQ